MKAKGIFQNEKICCSLIMIVIIVAGLISVRHLNIPCIMDDELGYWGNAAYLCGYDWSDVMKNMNSYSYGYSLILALFLKLLPSSEIVYQGAVFLNYIMIAGTFLILYKISKEILENTSLYIRLIVCLAISAYPSYRGFANVTLAETLLLFLGTLTIYLFFRIIEKPSLKGYILFIAANVYMYMVHQRCIFILIFSLIALMIRVFGARNKRNVGKDIFATAIFLILVLCIYRYLNYFFDGAINISEMTSQANTYASEIDKAKNIFSLTGLIRIMKTLVCQFYYMIVSTVFLVFFTIWSWINESYRNIKAKIQGKKNVFDSYFLKKTYVILLLAGTFVISVLSCSSLDRLDQYFYGRYFEFILAIPMLYGFDFLINKREKLKNNGYVFLCGTLAVLCIIVNYIFNTVAVNETGYFVSTNVISIDRFFSSTYDWYRHITQTLLISMLLFWSLKKNPNSKENIKGIVCLGVLITFFVLNSKNFVDGIFRNNDNASNWNELLSEAYNDDSDIYYLNSVNSRANRGRFQFLLLEKKLSCINFDQIPFIGNNTKIIVKASDENEFKRHAGNYVKVLEINGMQLWSCKDNSNVNVSWSNVQLGMGASDICNIRNNEHIISNGAEGYLIYGQHIGISAGHYQIAFSMEAFNEDAYGWCGLKWNDVIIKKIEFTPENLDENNKIYIEIDSTFETMTDVEFCVYLENGTVVSLEEIKYKKLDNSVIVGENDISDIKKICDELEKRNIYENIYYIQSSKNAEYDLSVIQSMYKNGDVYLTKEISKDMQYFIVYIPETDIFSLNSNFEIMWMNYKYALLINKDVMESMNQKELNNQVDIEFFRRLNKGKYSDTNKVYHIPGGLYIMEIEYTVIDALQDEIVLVISDDFDNREVIVENRENLKIRTWLYAEENGNDVSVELFSSVINSASINNIRLNRLSEIDLTKWDMYEFDKFNVEDYICMVYRVLLGRNPDAFGLDSWKKSIENGGDIKNIYEQIQSSEEFIRKTID